MKKFIHVDIYDCTIIFFVEPTKLEFEMMYHDNVERIKDDEYKQMYTDMFENDKCGGFTTFLECGDFVCCIKDAMNHNYVAHEILHTCMRLLWARGIMYKGDSDEEPLAYLIGWLTSIYYKWMVDDKRMDIVDLYKKE